MTQKRRSNTVHLTVEIARHCWKVNGHKSKMMILEPEKLGGPKIKKDSKR